MRCFALIASAAAMAVLWTPVAGAAANSSPTTTVNAVAAAFNRGDLKGFAAFCDSPAYVIDDFPPHQWDGPNACDDWATAVAADMKKNKITNAKVALGTPWHSAITGNVAYVVVPATLAYLQNGKPVKETGSVWTVVLHKTASGWLMTSWSWGQH